MGLLETVGFLDKDVFVRTQLGVQEVATSRDGILDRESRLLLIYINDRKNFADLMSSLGERKMYKAAGGVEKCLELLVDLEYVECEAYSSRMATRHAPSRILSKRETHLVQKVADQVVDLEQRKSQIENVEPSSEVGLQEQALRNQTLKQEDKTVDELRHTVALLIERHAESDVKQTYLEALSQCHNLSWIFGLVQEMQRLSSGSKFEKVMYMAALAFKRGNLARG